MRVKEFMIIRISIILIVLLFINNVSPVTAKNAEVTITFSQPSYDFEMPTDQPINISIVGQVHCSSNAREVIVTLIVDAGNYSCSINPETMHFARGSSLQNFNVNLALPPGISSNFSATITVAGQYRYFPGALIYNIQQAQTTVNIINVSSDIPGYETEKDNGDTLSQYTDFIPIIAILIIIIAIIIVVVIIRRRKEMERQLLYLHETND